MTHKLVQKLSSTLDKVRIPASIKEAGELSVSQPFVLITPTYENTGAHGRATSYVPKQVEEFLKHNSQHMLGVIATGNKNYLDEYCKAGEDIRDRFGVPLYIKVEYSGTQEDIDNIDQGLKLIWQSL